MKKILLVSANRLAIPYPVYPIGLSYLVSHLKKNAPDFDIHIFDFNFNQLNDFVGFIQNLKPDYVCISLRNIDDNNVFEKNCFVVDYKNIVNIAKTESKAVVIVGGAGFSIFPEYLFDFLQPHFGIKGEGEESLLRLINCIESRMDYTGIDGLVYAAHGKTVLNQRNQFLQKLDLDFENSLIDFYWKYSGMLNVQTKRGCPYECIYCSYPVIEGRKVRTLDIKSIIETLTNLYFNKKINYVFFTDSIFNISNEFNSELAEAIIQSGIKIKWGAYFSPKNLTEKLLTHLSNAGLTHIEFGTDSFSDRQLKNYGKSFNFNEVLLASNLCNKVRVFFAHFLILGGYGETNETLNEGFENCKKIENSVFFPFVGMRIYPGTILYDIALHEGKINPDDKLLMPSYYVSDKININTLKERALATGMKWIFPDDENHELMKKLREKNRKGPLWEHLRRI